MFISFLIVLKVKILKKNSHQTQTKPCNKISINIIILYVEDDLNGITCMSMQNLNLFAYCILTEPPVFHGPQLVQPSRWNTIGKLWVSRDLSVRPYSINAVMTHVI